MAEDLPSVSSSLKFCAATLLSVSYAITVLPAKTKTNIYAYIIFIPLNSTFK